MKNLHWMTLLIPLFLFLGSSCASMFSKSRYPVQISSSPSSANFTIKTSNGKTVFSGRTPATVSLKASQGFFQSAHYTIFFSKVGYENYRYALSSTVDGWYAGNIFWGVLCPVGFLVIDPATGAMFRLDEQYVNVSLEESMLTTEAESGNQLKILNLEEIPASWKPHLLPLEPEPVRSK